MDNPTKAQRYAYHVLKGCSPAEAAKAAGYEHPRPPGDAQGLVLKAFECVKDDLQRAAIEEELERRREMVSEFVDYLRAVEVKQWFLETLGE